MGRSPCCEKVGLKKGPWTPEEDQKLLAYIEEHGHGSWRALPAKAGDLQGPFIVNTSIIIKGEAPLFFFFLFIFYNFPLDLLKRYKLNENCL